ncbi:hypothetical protein [Acetobacter aceti]|nr:hypothetical protein [Acetobacter aceti]
MASLILCVEIWRMKQKPGLWEWGSVRLEPEAVCAPRLFPFLPGIRQHPSSLPLKPDFN